MSQLRPWWLFLALSSLVGCPAGDDDDSADDGPVGSPPAVTVVSICEMPNSADTCLTDYGLAGAMQLRWRLSLSDEDGDLNNPSYFLILHSPPAATGHVESDMGDGGQLDVFHCAQLDRGSELHYEVWVRDAEGNESPHLDYTEQPPPTPPHSWQVPTIAGDNDCSPF